MVGDQRFCVLINDVHMWMMYHSIMGNTWVERIAIKDRKILQQPLLLKHFGIVIDINYSNDNSPLVAFPVFCLEESLFYRLSTIAGICSLFSFTVFQQVVPEHRAFHRAGVGAQNTAKDHPNRKTPLLGKGRRGKPERTRMRQRTCHLLEGSLLAQRGSLWSLRAK